MNRLAVVLALICFLLPPLPAKYVEGQLNAPVQVSHTSLISDQKDKYLRNYFETEMDLPCTFLFPLDGRPILLRCRVRLSKTIDLTVHT